MINELKIRNNDKSELIITQDKGYHQDGSRHPHTWSIVDEKELKQQSDPKAIEALIDKIINDNREKAVEYKQGKEKLFGFFVGQAMKVSGGKANPQLINEILKKKL